ncbi:hypothetical protein AB3G45_01780 [Shinella sp. S4-D37]|uniref:hypothetical protein n=1 Tax=Shinella sp. S4-D37 TaxID=3161999 RepID=UPI0034675622
MPLLKAAVAVALLAGLTASSVAASALDAGRDKAGQAIVIRGDGGKVLARLPLAGQRFAVSYRNSLYGTLAEERYAVLPDGRYRLVEIAADQLAVLEEYYAVPAAPQRAAGTDRRKWVVRPDPDRPEVIEKLSIAATDLGKRTVHVPGEPPLELWRLVENAHPFVVLDIEEKP